MVRALRHSVCMEISGVRLCGNSRKGRKIRKLEISRIGGQQVEGGHMCEDVEII